MEKESEKAQGTQEEEQKLEQEKQHAGEKESVQVDSTLQENVE